MNLPSASGNRSESRRQRLLVLLVTLLFTTISATAQKPMVHPGIFHTGPELERIRTNVAEGKEPWKSAWAKLEKSDAGINYKARVEPEMTNAYGIQNDGHAAYVLAIKWVASGEAKYAKASIGIIDAWSSTVKSAAKEPMRNGLGGSQMANAAEILAHGFKGSAGWAPADVKRAQTFFKEVIYPRIENGASANWGTSAMAGIMSIGVFSEDRTICNRAIEAYKKGFVVNGSLKGGCCGVTQYIDATGENAETGRDQPHSQGGVAHLVEVALIAWNQGLNLVTYNDDYGVRDYGVSGDNRLLIGMEYVAKYNLGEEVPYHPFFEYCNDVTKYPVGPSPAGRGNFSPIWMMANHLFTRVEMKAPYTRKVCESNGYQPEGSNGDHPGLGTLTYAIETK